MRRYLILITLVLGLSTFVQGQDMVDALRYSQLNFDGTARSAAMGNAIGALGGTFTSVVVNPAGLGLYRSGEFTVTPKSGQLSTETMYWQNNIEETDYKFTLDNISYVSAIPMKQQTELGLVSVNLGLGYHRLKDFNNKNMIAGNAVNGSYMDYFADNANRGIWSDYYEELAWQTDLLLYDEDLEEYWHDLQDAGYGQYQRKITDKNGSIDEYSIALGFNFNHKLYLGISSGIIDLFYEEYTQIMEQDPGPDDQIEYFNEFAFNTNLRTHGTGYNFKFGMIYKPVNEVRIGVSVHTPTFYRLHDYFQTNMTSSITYEDGTEFYQEYSPQSNYDYRLRTPLRANFSGAFIVGKKGLISLDYEYLNYAKANLDDGGDGYQFTDENADIEEAYKSAANIRIGGEYRLTSDISLRAGYENHGSPFQSNSFGAQQPNAGINRNVYAGGIGYKSGPFFFDVTYRRTVLDQFDLPYPIPVSTVYPAPQMASMVTVQNNVLFTFGYRF